MRLIDAHTHIRKGQEGQAVAFAKKGLWQLVCASNPNECKFVDELGRADRHIIPTYGLHPWYVQDFKLDSMDQWLHEAMIIGEIGLDGLWAPTPIEAQVDTFIYQLQMAVKLEKWVILHTKSAEGLILDYLREETPPGIIIHWYSGDDKYLEGFIELGCYFTLGPDIGTNPNTQNVCKKIPMDRILTETDGIDAVNWAFGGGCTFEDIPHVLESSLVHGASIRGVPVDKMKDRVYNNFMRILKEIIRG
ncbi:MAG TPA: TatD family hydrolase [Clostridia bacterium]|nr:TatD family hydrolase [Clostridia bacterium]